MFSHIHKWCVTQKNASNIDANKTVTLKNNAHTGDYNHYAYAHI